MLSLYENVYIASKNPFAKQILHGFLSVAGTEWTVTVIFDRLEKYTFLDWIKMRMGKACSRFAACFLVCFAKMAG